MRLKAVLRRGLLLAPVVVSTVGLSSAPAALSAGASAPVLAPPSSCQRSSQASSPLSLTVDGQPATGLYALPTGPPRGIVVVGHGHTALARDVAKLVEQIAASDDVIALAMDYRGTNPTTKFGWRVREGALDSIAAAEMFDRFCPGSSGYLNVVLGISMGGNMSGLAVASGARRQDGSPLFDFWFDVSGVTNVPEIYADAQAISLVPATPVSSEGATATTEMQQEFGGTPLSNPLSYLAGSPVFLTSAMKAAGLRGVFISHGVLDGMVTSDMSDQMAVALTASGIPVDFSTSVFKAPGTSSGLTIDGYLGALSPGYSSPFAGHVADVVLQSALDKLHALYHRAVAPDGTSLALADGLLGPHPVLTVPRLPIPPG
jgi:hypothetical protein